MWLPSQKGGLGRGPGHLVLQKLLTPIGREMALAMRRLCWFVILERLIYDLWHCFLHIRIFEFFQNYVYMYFYCYCGKIYKTKFTIVTILECRVHWHLVHSQCCATVTTGSSRTFSSSRR